MAIATDTRPDFQILPETNRADTEFFLGQLRLLLPIDLFRRP